MGAEYVALREANKAARARMRVAKQAQRRRLRADKEYCIYVVRNTYNGRRYVGQTSDFKHRVAGAFSAASCGAHPSKFFQADFDAVGRKGFECDVLLRCPEEWLAEFEKDVIQRMQPEYNVVKYRYGRRSEA